MSLPHEPTGPQQPVESWPQPGPGREPAQQRVAIGRYPARYPEPKWPKILAGVCVLGLIVVGVLAFLFLGPGTDDDGDNQPDDVKSPVEATPSVVMQMPNGPVAIKCDGFGFRVYQSKDAIAAVPDIACAGILDPTVPVDPTAPTTPGG